MSILDEITLLHFLDINFHFLPNINPARTKDIHLSPETAHQRYYLVVQLVYGPQY